MVEERVRTALGRCPSLQDIESKKRSGRRGVKQILADYLLPVKATEAASSLPVFA